MDEPVIQIENLIKEYKSSDGTIVRAVNNISMSVAAGEIVGLLGANGAGKNNNSSYDCNSPAADIWSRAGLRP